jgi:asparagine synthase (glutamine-hydrolysing)
VNTVFSISSDIKIKNINKQMIKQIATTYLPDKIINREKKGFNTPFNEWLFEEFKDDILDTILKVNKQTNFFHENYINFIYNQAKNNKFKQHLYALWLFSRWYRKNY